ncbi:hypothetical protein SASPL_109345 [Salvia splendens]|uniref:Retrovirus-related Pol polyprotein from transposon TNT 1-94-like beta-barrel domain-containing protein n=1 Tax=Salvia splendens TaxID=180675 RepID=A0A8X9A689_SALSN|nr:hypothetical protein SASPL_109345 [Salvia splendens]
MAKNREPVNPVEESESDSSKEGSSSGEESDADLDPTPPQNKPQPQIPAAKPSPLLPHPSSDDEDDSGSETESESNAPEVRTLTAKLVEETPKSNRKAKSKPAADTASKDAKKPKKSPAAESEKAEKNSNMFHRLWSEEDEIVILEGMIEFQNNIGYSGFDTQASILAWRNLNDVLEEGGAAPALCWQQRLRLHGGVTGRVSADFQLGAVLFEVFIRGLVELKFGQWVVDLKILILYVFYAQKPESKSDEEWEFEHHQVCGFIRQFVEENVYHHVDQETHARTLWDKLENLYASKSGNNKLFLLKKMMMLRYKDGTSIADHVSEFQSSLTQLLGMGVTLDDEIVGLWLLATLPDSWETLRISLINSAPSGIVTLEIAKNGVLNEEVRRRSQGSSSQSEVLVTEDRGEAKIKAKRKNCFKWKKENKAGRDKSERKEDEKSDCVATTTTSDDDLLVVCDKNVISLAYDETSWVIDTGASLHVTSKKEFFTSYTSGDFGVLKMGNDGLVKVVGTGDVCLVTNNGTKFTLRDVRHAPDIRLNLISAGKLDDEGFCNTFSEGQWKLTKGHLPDPVQDHMQDDIVDDQQGIDDVDAPMNDDENDQHQAPIAPPTVPLRRSIRDRRSNVKYTSEEYVLLTDGGEPECYDEAMESECKDKWVEAMKDELQSLYDNHTFELVKLPKGKRALKNRWVYSSIRGFDRVFIRGLIELKFGQWVVDLKILILYGGIVDP